MELAVQRKGDEGQKEEITEEWKRFTIQVMAKELLEELLEE